MLYKLLAAGSFVSSGYNVISRQSFFLILFPYLSVISRQSFLLIRFPYFDVISRQSFFLILFPYYDVSHIL